MRILSIVTATLALLCTGCKQAPPPSPSETTSETSNQAILRVHQAGYDEETTNRAADQYVAVDTLTLPTDLDPKRQYLMYEGPVLENDVVAYRIYADSRHRVDIFGKSVPDLVMDTVGWHYHDVMGWGSDILKVGNSLGMGSPAIYYADSVYTLSNDLRKTVASYSDGDETGFVMTLHDLHIGPDTFTIEHTWTIGGGRSHALTQLEVIKGQLPAGARFCAGIVRHLDDHHTASNDQRKVLYTYGKQSYHGHDMGMAIVVDKGITTTYLDHELSHIWLFDTDLQAASYEIAAAWELDLQQVKSQADFESLILQ